VESAWLIQLDGSELVVSVLLPDGWHDCQPGTLRVDDRFFHFVTPVSAPHPECEVFGPRGAVIAVMRDWKLLA